jgi:hypothetical protein
MRRTLVIHPFAFALWPVLFVFANNQDQLVLAQVWPSVFLLLGLTSLAFLLFRLILRDVKKSGILLSLFLILFFSFGQVLQLVAVAPMSLLIAWVLLFLGGSAFGVMTNRGWDETTKILNVVALVLVFSSVFNILIHEYNEQGVSQERICLEPIEIGVEQSCQQVALPNIYYIILDGYGRADILDELYSYDNSEFLEFLESREFHVADRSRSNYAQTALSLASSLNLDYLDGLVQRLGEEGQDRDPLEVLIERSAVIKFLKQCGYTVVAFPTGYSPTTIDGADILMRGGWAPNGLEIGLLLTTPIPWLIVSTSEFSLETQHADRILGTLGRIPDTAEVRSPHFVFVHILAPHPPFLFDADGDRIEPERPHTYDDGSHFFEDGGTRSEYMEGYIGQLQFVNKRLEVLIDDLLSRSSQPAIIVLQADHGSGLLLDWDDLENTYLNERFSILNAFLLPGDGAADLYDEITPVNTFRLILNHYFDTGLELLEDRSYFSTWEQPYEFIDVTDLMQSE